MCVAEFVGKDRTTENIQRAWAEITALMRQSNAEMFESKAMTRDKIQNGEYLEFLESHGPKLADWKARFERMNGMSDRPRYSAILTIAVPPLSRTLLMIEFEYTRKACITVRPLFADNFQAHMSTLYHCKQCWRNVPHQKRLRLLTMAVRQSIVGTRLLLWFHRR